MTIHHITTSLLVGILLLIGFAETSRAEIPQVISYQGKVTDTSGNPVADGSYTMRFRIFNASSGGTALWDSGARTVALADGAFSVLLGESPQPALTLNFSQDYWLAVTFSGVDQTPRQRMASAGYAYMASGLVPGTEVSGSVTSGTNAAIKGKNTASTGTAYGVIGETNSSSGHGVRGVNYATTGYAGAIFGLAMSPAGRGVAGECNGTAGIGVVGWAGATTGSTNGVFGYSASSAGAGVVGQAAATTGGPHGVYGTSAATAGRGVTGVATATTGTAYGVYGQSAANSGVGVFGQAPHSGVVGTATSTGGSDAEISGVYGWTPSTLGYGVHGRVTSTTGATYGVYGHSASTAGVGVFGQAGATTGSTNGVLGYSASPAGAGVVGHAAATTGGPHGVYGASAATEGRGVTGVATATMGATYGVYGENRTDGAGVKGVATATGGSVSFGVYGESRSNSGRGVWGEAASTTGTTYGGVFRTHSPDGIGISARGGVNGYGGVFEGNVAIRSLSSGSIVLELGEGLDYAEGFNVSNSGQVGPGTVLVIDARVAGELSPSSEPYDTRVAGVVAGANGVGSGVRLGAGQFDHDVALAGRVYCSVDATEAGIELGDLLTTSKIPGYAMKASDHLRAHGAILGKAMERLEKGRKAQILVLVTLQ